MRIRRVQIEHFRGIEKADIALGGTTLFVGPNNVGKSTLLEALDLTLGSDRLSRTDAINEHDFWCGNVPVRPGPCGGE